MNAPDKLKQLEVKFRLAWSHGTLPDLVRVALIAAALAGGGVWLNWDRIAQMLSSAPVWVLVALFISFSSAIPADTANRSPEALAVSALPATMARLEDFFNA